MKRRAVFAGFALTAVLTLVSACQQEDSAWMIKRAQLAGNENLRLKKEIEQKDAQIALLTQQKDAKYDKIVKQKDAEVAVLKQKIEQTQQKIRTLQEQFDRTSEQAQRFGMENQRFKEDFRQKDSQIAELQQQVNLMDEKNMRTQEHKMIISLMEILAECGNKLAKYEPVEALPVIPFSVADANEPAQQK